MTIKEPTRRLYKLKEVLNLVGVRKLEPYWT